MATVSGTGDPLKNAQKPARIDTSGDPLERGAETVLGSTDRTRAANEAVRAFARTARSLTFYDAGNTAVRNFIDELRACVMRFHEGYGDLVLEIGPVEISVEGEPVYSDRDRERSLAGKLYRDGVRTLTLSAGASWDELTQVLVILSVRFVGLRMHEDDIVTLLWRANLKSITVRAVDGFVARDADGSGDGMGGVDDGSAGARGSADVIAAGMSGETEEGRTDAGAALRAQIVSAAQVVPADFDYPPPALPAPVAVHYATLPLDVRAPLMMEVAATRLGANGLELVEELIAAIRDPNDPITFDAAVTFLAEVRDFVLGTDEIEPFVSLFERYRELVGSFPEPGERGVELLAAFGTTDTIARLLDGLVRTLRTVPPGLDRLIDAASGDPLELLFDVLERERGDAARAIVRQLLENRLPAAVGRTVARFEKSEGAVAADLLRVLATRAPEAAQQLVGKITAGDDLEVQTEFLVQLGHLPMTTVVRSYLSMLLRAKALPVRLQALDAVLARGEKSAIGMLTPFGEARAYAAAPEEELAAIGVTMARLDPERALAQFGTWCRPPGWIAKIMRRRPPMVRIALGGLEWLDAGEAEALIEVLEASGDPNVRAVAEAAASNRRRRMTHEAQEAVEKEAAAKLAAVAAAEAAAVEAAEAAAMMGAGDGAEGDDATTTGDVRATPDEHREIHVGRKSIPLIEEILGVPARTPSSAGIAAVVPHATGAATPGASASTGTGAARSSNPPAPPARPTTPPAPPATPSVRPAAGAVLARIKPVSERPRASPPPAPTPSNTSSRAMRAVRPDPRAEDGGVVPVREESVLPHTPAPPRLTLRPSRPSRPDPRAEDSADESGTSTTKPEGSR